MTETEAKLECARIAAYSKPSDSLDRYVPDVAKEIYDFVLNYKRGQLK